MRLLLGSLVVTALFTPALALAVNGVPANFSYEGRLYDQNNDPRTGTFTFSLEVLSEDSSCSLYHDVSSHNLTATNGYFSVAIGSGTRGTNDSGESLSKVFSNKGMLNGKTVVGGNPCAWTPVSGAARKLRVVVRDASNVSTELTPHITIGSTPNAMVAELLQGFAPEDFVRVNAVGVSQTNVDTVFSSTNYPKLTALLDGTSPYYAGAANGAIALPVTPGSPASPTAGQIWFDSASDTIKYRDGSAVVTLSSSKANSTQGSTLADTSVSFAKLPSVNTGRLLGRGTSGMGSAEEIQLGSGLAMSGNTLSANAFAALGCAAGASPYFNGTSWGCIAVDSGNQTLAVVKRDALGNFETNTAKLRSGAEIYGTTAGSVAIVAPAVVSNYVLTLPQSTGSAGQMLTTNGSGVTSWATPPLSPWSESGGNVHYTAGNVGIGTTAPAAKLDVNGVLNVSSEIKLGGYPLFKAVGANYNIAAGQQSMSNITSGSNNIGVGYNTLSSITTGNNNVAVGSQSLRLAQSNSLNNVGIGYNTFGSMTSGQHNVAIGADAAAGMIGGTYNIAIGTGTSLNTGNYQLNIGNSIYGDMSQSASATKIGIGYQNSTPAATLDVAGFMKLKRYNTAAASSLISACTGGANSASDGLIAMTSLRTLCVCDGSGWKDVTTVATACVWQ